MVERIKALVVLAVLCLGSSGCLMEAVLDAKGGGTMKLRQRLAENSKLAATQRQLESPNVTVTSATEEKDRWAVYELKFADVTKLNTAKYFERAAITQTDGPNGTKVFTAKVTNKIPAKLPPNYIEYYGKDVKIVVTFPGEIVKTNGEAKGATATWNYPLNDFMSKPEILMEATYKTAGGAAAPAAPDAPAVPAATAAPAAPKS